MSSKFSALKVSGSDFLDVKSRANSWWKRSSLSLAFWNQGLTVSQSLEFTILYLPKAAA